MTALYTAAMDHRTPSSTDVQIRLPAAPAIVAGVRHIAWVGTDGKVESLPPHEAKMRLRHGAAPILCHTPHTARRLKVQSLRGLDVLELFAFVRPACFCLPTPLGLAEALGLPKPKTHEEEAVSLVRAAKMLLGELRTADPSALPIAWAMARGNWPWGGSVLAALGASGDSPHSRNLSHGLHVWNKLKDWSDYAPEPPTGHLPVDPSEAEGRLIKLLGEGSEQRPQQKEFTRAAANAFQPRESEGAPKLALSEAGTGVGKTLGYIAPASLWAEKNHGPVWISTYTRNLQRQLDGELDRLYPDPGEKRRKVVVRKGRENYLCLLNMEEAVRQLAANSAAAPALGLMARWALASRDGDMVGGDFPGWLSDPVGPSRTVDLTDTRGECIYTACNHFSKCFVEKNVRRAKRANIVVANHALVMIQAALAGPDGEGGQPTRYVFDEGHHLFDAADSAFSAHLSGLEGADLRRWLLGSEESGRSRAKGIQARIDGLPLSEASVEAVEEIVRAAQALPGPGWHQRVAGGMSVGPMEKFLLLIRQQVYARAKDSRSPYTIETDVLPALPGLAEAAQNLEAALARLAVPIAQLIKGLAALLDDEADDMDSPARQRIEGTCRGLERRGLMQLNVWRDMLKFGAERELPDQVEWFSIERNGGYDRDVGMHRHFIDPTKPFAEEVVKPAQGALITSATLRDSTGDPHEDWLAADDRTGLRHLDVTPFRLSVPSPFDYGENTRVLIVTDLDKNDPGQVAAAYRELFIAAGGGGLGLFTAINRLRTVHERIAAPLEDRGIALMAQHLEGMDIGTLIDIFRAEENTCLLGTDAVRDGVDVPGDSLRLIVFDRVPWPRPSILHRARKGRSGGSRYDDLLTRLKLKQAFGRLVRRSSDRGVFVMLDKAMPSRLLTAFPDGVEVQRLGLKDAIELTQDFLNK